VTALTRRHCNRGKFGNMNRKQTDRLVRPLQGNRQFEIEQELCDIKKGDHINAF